jgi:glycogen debranching enzyme
MNVAKAIVLFCYFTAIGASAQELLIEEAGRQNVFLNNEEAQVHLVHQAEGRTVFAFPAENSGVAFWFSGRIKYRPGTLRSESDSSGQVVLAEFEVESPAHLEAVIMDSLRVVRDHNNGANTPARVTNARNVYAERNSLPEDWATQRVERDPSFYEYSRVQPGHGRYRLKFSSETIQWDEGRPFLPKGRLQVKVRCPFPRTASLPLEELLHEDFLAGDSPRERASLNALNFLVNDRKMMAGSWRFLTYFGRDTLISLGMLEPILSEQALENGVRSVLTRLSPEGAVAHEEDIGSWAEWRHLQEIPPSPSLEPVYDYKMVDDDLLLPVTLHKLKERAVWRALFEEPDSRQAIARNAAYVLDKLSQEKPILLLPGEKVGEWRDSENGLAHGNDAYSVNGALTVPALEALDDIFEQLSEPEQAARARKLIPVYRRLADRFWVDIEREEMKSRLETYGESVPSDSRATWNSLLADLTIPATLTVPILSFNEDGSPNVVTHSDVAFNLFYGNLSDEELDRILTFLEQPFPLGLTTPVGPIVANPILSPDPSHHKLLGFGQYHGMVVWSWQSAMLQFGLIRQAGLHPSFRQRVNALVETLGKAEERAGELATSELWAVDLTADGLLARGYGVAGDQTESNAMQLWSTVYPSLRFVKERF